MLTSHSALMCPGAVARAVQVVGDAARSATARRASRQRAAVQLVVNSAGPAIRSRRVALGQTLREAVAHAMLFGFPAPVFSIIGRQNDEIPLNRLLKWILSPGESHGAGDVPLRALANYVGFKELLDDLDAGQTPAVYGEEAWPDNPGCSDRPDLLIVTPQCALLVENKVWSKESRPDQYASYRQSLHAWGETRGQTHRRLFLTARNRRALPDGWTRMLTHRELATAFWRAGHDIRLENPGNWGGINMHVVAHALREEPDVRPAIAEARTLMNRLDTADPYEVVRAEALLQLLTPWSTQ